MIRLNINEIKPYFSSYLAKVSNGETVVVCRRNVPIAEIKPIAALPNKKRPIGLAGKEYPGFQISDAFSDPQNGVYLSAVSAWEINVKYRLGKLPLPLSPDKFIR